MGNSLAISKPKINQKPNVTVLKLENEKKLSDIKSDLFGPEISWKKIEKGSINQSNNNTITKNTD